MKKEKNFRHNGSCRSWRTVVTHEGQLSPMTDSGHPWLNCHPRLTVITDSKESAPIHPSGEDQDKSRRRQFKPPQEVADN